MCALFSFQGTHMHLCQTPFSGGSTLSVTFCQLRLVFGQSPLEIVEIAVLHLREIMEDAGNTDTLAADYRELSRKIYDGSGRGLCHEPAYRSH